MDGTSSLAALVRQRAERFARFAEWEALHPATITPGAAVEAIGTLYELLPAESRQRPIDTSGVRVLHDALRHTR